ncbi:MAG: TRAP transporter small permease subunit [Deltaproteobacteria bacterium]|nr:TRAP transporter small permease subunit [Deltaproteobacteria bacterium]
MFRKTIDYLTYILEWIANACFVGAVLLVVISVVFRPLKIPAPWSDEGACWLFIWTTFLSAAIALKRNLHIRIDVLLLKLPPKLKGGFLCFLDLLCLPFCIGLIYGSYQMIQASLHMRSAVLEIPMISYYLPLFIGFAIMAVYLTISVLDFILIKPKKSEGR